MAQTLDSYTTIIQQEVDDTSLAAKSVIQRQIKAIYQIILIQASKYLVSNVSEDVTVSVGNTVYPATLPVIVMKQVAYRPAAGGNFKILHEISYEDYLDTYLNRPNSIPVHYFFDGDVLNIAPAPNEIGTLRKVYRPYSVELVGTSIIPDRYTDVLINGVIARFKQWEDNSIGNTMYDRWYSTTLRDMILDLSSQANVPQSRLYK